MITLRSDGGATTFVEIPVNFGPGLDITVKIGTINFPGNNADRPYSAHLIWDTKSSQCFPDKAEAVNYIEQAWKALPSRDRGRLMRTLPARERRTV